MPPDLRSLFGSAGELVIAKGVARTMVVTRLRVLTATLIVFAGLGIVGRPSAPRQDPTPADAQVDRNPSAPTTATLAIEVDHVPVTVKQGTDVEVRATVANLGHVPAREVVVRTEPGAGLLSDISVTSDQTAFEQTVGDLLPGFKIRLPPVVVRAQVVGEQSCKVTIQSPDFPADSLGATCQHIVTVVEPDLSLSMTGPTTDAAGNPATGNLRVVNFGKLTLRDVCVRARFPEGVELVSPPSKARFDAAGRVLTWEPFALEPGEKSKVELPFTVRMDSVGRGRIVAVAANDSVWSNAVGSELELDVIADPPVIDVGQATTLQVRVRNRGFRKATDLGLSVRANGNVRLRSTAGAPTLVRLLEPDLLEFAFPHIHEIEPGDEIAVRINLVGRRSGDADIRGVLTYPGSKVPVGKTVGLEVKEPPRR